MPIPDSDRPPVLAHLRFQADRAEFQRLDLAARFKRILETNLWGAENSVSGLGSELVATAALRAELPQLLRALGARTLLDAPCGDAAWINSLQLPCAYVGIDIVPDLINQLQLKATRGEAFGAYHQMDLTRDALPAADVALCRDCLVHLSFDNIGRAIANFRASGAQWLMTTHFPDLQQNLDCEDGDWRALNFERAPFAWGPPIHLLNEQCDEAGGGWRDKSLGVWRLTDIS
jgi:hypothetical protein